MSVVPEDFELEYDQRLNPLLWVVPPTEPFSCNIDTSDEVMDRYLGTGSSQAISSFGHDELTGVHFLLTRKGTSLHTDRAYLRFSHQLILRNDGNRIRGLPRYDLEQNWHPMFVPGTLYCLDTWSPHQGTADPRFGDRGRGMKVAVTFDRPFPMGPEEARELLYTYLDKQMADFGTDPYLAKKGFKKWKGPYA